jgi:hypothetical protein
MNSVLDHYNNLLGLFNRQNDFRLVGKVLEGQAKVAEDRTKTAKATMEMYQSEVEKWKDMYDNTADKNSEAA